MIVWIWLVKRWHDSIGVRKKLWGSFTSWPHLYFHHIRSCESYQLKNWCWKFSLRLVVNHKQRFWLAECWMVVVSTLPYFWLARINTQLKKKTSTPNHPKSSMTKRKTYSLSQRPSNHFTTLSSKFHSFLFLVSYFTNYNNNTPLHIVCLFFLT